MGAIWNRDGCLLRLLCGGVAAVGAYIEEAFLFPIMLNHRAAFRAGALRLAFIVAAGMLAHGSAHGAGAISPLVLCLQAADGAPAVAEGMLAFGAAAGAGGFAVFGDIMGGAAPGHREQMVEFITAQGTNAAGFSLRPLVV